MTRTALTRKGRCVGKPQRFTIIVFHACRQREERGLCLDQRSPSRENQSNSVTTNHSNLSLPAKRYHHTLVSISPGSTRLPHRRRFEINRALPSPDEESSATSNQRATTSWITQPINSLVQRRTELIIHTIPIFLMSFTPGRLLMEGVWSPPRWRRGRRGM